MLQNKESFLSITMLFQISIRASGIPVSRMFLKLSETWNEWNQSVSTRPAPAPASLDCVEEGTRHRLK